MNRSLLCSLLLLALVAAGCRSVEPETVYTPENAGPWQDAGIATTFGTSDAGITITVAVGNYATTPDDYVQRFVLVDQMGGNRGERVFGPDETPSESFVLDPEVRQVTVTISSRSGKQWTSGPLTVPSSEE